MEKQYSSNSSQPCLDCWVLCRVSFRGDRCAIMHRMLGRHSNCYWSLLCRFPKTTTHCRIRQLGNVRPHNFLVVCRKQIHLFERNLFQPLQIWMCVNSPRKTSMNCFYSDIHLISPSGPDLQLFGSTAYNINIQGSFKMLQFLQLSSTKHDCAQVSLLTSDPRWQLAAQQFRSARSLSPVFWYPSDACGALE